MRNILATLAMVISVGFVETRVLAAEGSSQADFSLKSRNDDYARALDAYNNDDCRSCVEIMQSLIKTESTARCHYLLGAGYYGLSEFANAKIEFSKAMELDPQCPTYRDAFESSICSALYVEGAKAYMQGYDQICASKMKEALSIRNDPLFHYFRGKALQRLKQFDQALDEFEVASSLDPGNPQYVQALAGLRKFGEGTSDYGNLIFPKRDIEPEIRSCEQRLMQCENPQVRLRLAQLLHSLGGSNIAQAIVNYQKALDADPAKVDIHYFLGSAYEASSQPKLAIVEYNKYLSSAPAGIYVNSCYRRLNELH